MNLRHHFSHLRAVAGIMHGSRAFGGPVQAYLSFSNRCNIRCIHCFYYSPYLDSPTRQPLRRARLKGEKLPDYGYLKRLQRIEADTGRFRILIDELLSMGTRYYNLGTNGEPFMHSSALEYMDIVKRAGSYCLVNTNGTLLTRKIIDELIKMGLDNMRITTMAGTPEMYVCTHPGSPKEMFFKLKENLLYLAEQKAALGVRKPEITLVFVVIAQNADEVFKFAKFAADVKADRVIYRLVDNVRDPGLENVVPTKEQTVSVQKQITEAKAYLELRGILHNISYFQQVFPGPLNTTTLYQIIPCYYGWLSVVIEPDGKVYPCCRCYEILGNIYEKKFHEIWNGEAYRRFRKKAIKMHIDKVPIKGCECNHCVHHIANLRVYKALHPLRGHLTPLRQLSPFGLKKEK